MPFDVREKAAHRAAFANDPLKARHTLRQVRVLDEANDRWLDSVTLYLTPDEGGQLAAYLEQLAEDPVGLHHAHLDETEDIGVNAKGVTIGRVVREITVAVYVDENMDAFGERFRRSIETGE
jgi:uncharacterized protein YwlG (UPF0340 family)